MERLSLRGNPPEEEIEVHVRRSARARRLTLRISQLDGRVTLTLPMRLPLRQGRDFLGEKAGWVRAQLARRPDERVVAAGGAVPFLGGELEIVAAPVRRVTREEVRLLIPEGRPAGASVAGWLKAEARHQLSASARRHADALGRDFTKLTLRDTRSRWGSCAHHGGLMFSWRLVMAPLPVLDYVAAHEVAHLEHMDHSPAFWAVCARLCPDWKTHRRWLHTHGSALHRVRFDA